MDGVYIRSANMTEAQEEQRLNTYVAARILRERGIRCEVREWWCSSPQDDAASIVLKFD